MKKSWSLWMLLLAVPGAWGQQHAEGPSADAALAKLIAGNRRYVQHRQQYPDQSLPHRKELVSGQHPFAVILGCADSRVPPELLFDQGLGDLFVIRVAGNLVDDVVLGSIEYAVEHLGTKLIMVLGHEKCGAVSAAVEGGTVRDILVRWWPRFSPRSKRPVRSRGTRSTTAWLQMHGA